MVSSNDPKALHEKLQEVLSDEEFAKGLLQADSPEDVQAALNSKDVDLSLDEIRAIGELIRKVNSGEISPAQLQGMADGELSKNELEEATGGLFGLVVLVLNVAGFLGGGTCGGSKCDNR